MAINGGLSLIGALLLFFLLMFSTGGRAQTLQNACTGELGDADWSCDSLAPVPSEVFDGQDELLPLPGTPDPANPVLYRQIGGDPVTFDAETGERTSGASSGASNGTSDSGAVFVLTEGTYWCMLAESNGEAALFDAPEGSFVSSASEFPTSTWLSESVEAIIAPDTKLKYIVYTHSHWDHVGAAGLVYDHFAQDNPTIVSSKRIRAALKTRDDLGDPSSVHGNNRGVPIPEKLEATDYRQLKVGGLRFELRKLHAHQRGDLMVFLDKTVAENAAEGIASSIFMVVDTIFPGWVPFFALAVSTDIGGYYAAMDTILSYDFDVLVAGHFTRLGTKVDVELNRDFFADVLEGSKTAIETVSADDVAVGTGVFDPTNPNAGNILFVINEQLDRRMDVCEAYVLDSGSRNHDWLAELGGVEITLRSQCFAVIVYILIG